MFGIYSGYVSDHSYVKTLLNIIYNYEEMAGRLYFRVTSHFEYIPATNLFVLLLVHVRVMCVRLPETFPGSQHGYLGMHSSSLS